MSGEEVEWLDALWFVASVAALVVLFAAALRVRVYGAGWRRWALRLGVIAGAAAAVLAANIAVYRHDAHLDFTREEAFTPSREAGDIVRSLQEPVQLVYFYQKENAAGRAAVTMLELLGRLNPRLSVEAVDIDRNPARAGAFGVQLYNTAVIVAATHRVQVVSTDDREVALAYFRAKIGEDAGETDNQLAAFALVDLLLRLERRDDALELACRYNNLHNDAQRAINARLMTEATQWPRG